MSKDEKDQVAGSIMGAKFTATFHLRSLREALLKGTAGADLLARVTEAEGDIRMEMDDCLYCLGSL